MICDMGLPTDLARQLAEPGAGIGSVDHVAEVVGLVRHGIENHAGPAQRPAARSLRRRGQGVGLAREGSYNFV